MHSDCLWWPSAWVKTRLFHVTHAVHYPPGNWTLPIYLLSFGLEPGLSYMAWHPPIRWRGTDRVGPSENLGSPSKIYPPIGGRPAPCVIIPCNNRTPPASRHRLTNWIACWMHPSEIPANFVTQTRSAIDKS